MRAGSEGHECGSPISLHSKAAHGALTLGHVVLRHLLDIAADTCAVKRFKPGLDNAMSGLLAASSAVLVKLAGLVGQQLLRLRFDAQDQVVISHIGGSVDGGEALG